jgi:hypothetical protein
VSRNSEFADTAARLLSQSGIAEVQYVTAEFEPHSSKDRPDLLFYPHEGPNSNRLFFVEMRIDLPRSGSPLSVTALVEHRAFVQDEMPDTQLYFAVAVETFGGLADDWPELASHGIKVLAPIDSGRALSEAVSDWSSTALPEPWTPGGF